MFIASSFIAGFGCALFLHRRPNVLHIISRIESQKPNKIMAQTLFAFEWRRNDMATYHQPKHTHGFGATNICENRTICFEQLDAAVAFLSCCWQLSHLFNIYLEYHVSGVVHPEVLRSVARFGQLNGQTVLQYESASLRCAWWFGAHFDELWMHRECDSFGRSGTLLANKHSINRRFRLWLTLFLRQFSPYGVYLLFFVGCLETLSYLRDMVSVFTLVSLSSLE